MLRIKCPSCANRMEVPEVYLGRKTKCTSCTSVFEIEKPKPEPFNLTEVSSPTSSTAVRPVHGEPFEKLEGSLSFARVVVGVVGVLGFLGGLSQMIFGFFLLCRSGSDYRLSSDAVDAGIAIMASGFSSILLVALVWCLFEAFIGMARVLIKIEANTRAGAGS